MFISHKVFLESFCRSQLPHKSVNLSLYYPEVTQTLQQVMREQNGFDVQADELRLNVEKKQARFDALQARSPTRHPQPPAPSP